MVTLNISLYTDKIRSISWHIKPDSASSSGFTDQEDLNDYKQFCDALIDIFGGIQLGGPLARVHRMVKRTVENMGVTNTSKALALVSSTISDA